MNNILKLPDKILFSSYSNINDFGEAVYQIFKKDFVDTKPTFRGIRLGLKRRPLIEGKEYTFYHFTTKGKDENNRTPDIKRMERITFPRPMIDNSEHSYLKVWRNKRRGKKRILIFHEAERYLIILDDRGDFILPWTAYYIEYNNRKRKLLKEYEAYKNAETAGNNS